MVAPANPAIVTAQLKSSNRSGYCYLVHRKLPYSVSEEQRCFGDHLHAYTGLKREVFVQLPD